MKGKNGQKNGRRSNRKGRGRGRGGNARISLPPAGTFVQQRTKVWIGINAQANPTPATPGWDILLDPSKSLGFVQRFGNTWASWRMIAADVQLNIVAKNPEGTEIYPSVCCPTALVEFPNIPSSTFVIPNSEPMMLEVPGCKNLVMNSANPRSFGRFKWHATDINFLPFQTFDGSLATTLSSIRLVGFCGWTELSGDQAEANCRGRICIEFKDLKWYLPPGIAIADKHEEMQRDDDTPSAAKRLQRIKLY